MELKLMNFSAATRERDLLIVPYGIETISDIYQFEFRPLSFNRTLWN